MMKKLLFIFVFVFAVLEFKAQNTSVTFSGSVLQQPVDNHVSKVSAIPNPFVDFTTISFVSSHKQHIIFEVKNILGKSIYRYEFIAEQGLNKVLFQRKNLKKGMYIYTIQTDDEVISKRLVAK